MSPKITLVAWCDRLQHNKFIFVAVPNERGRYVRTDMCVAFVECGYCGSITGEPCKDRCSGRYCAGTHTLRRRLYTQKKRLGEISDVGARDVIADKAHGLHENRGTL